MNDNVEKIVLSDDIEAFRQGSFFSLPTSTKDPSVSERIEDSELIHGLPFEKLEYTIYYKEKMGLKQ